MNGSDLLVSTSASSNGGQGITNSEVDLVGEILSVLSPHLSTKSFNLLPSLMNFSLKISSVTLEFPS